MCALQVGVVEGAVAEWLVLRPAAFCSEGPARARGLESWLRHYAAFWERHFTFISYSSRLEYKPRSSLF